MTNHPCLSVAPHRTLLVARLNARLMLLCSGHFCIPVANTKTYDGTEGVQYLIFSGLRPGLNAPTEISKTPLIFLSIEKGRAPLGT